MPIRHIHRRDSGPMKEVSRKIAREMSGEYFLFIAILSCFVSNIFLDEAQECGRVGSDFNCQMIGGVKPEKRDWPWLVALINRKQDSVFCGGSLLSAKHVLSGKVATRKMLTLTRMISSGSLLPKQEYNRNHIESSL